MMWKILKESKELMAFCGEVLRFQLRKLLCYRNLIWQNEEAVIHEISNDNV